MKAHRAAALEYQSGIVCARKNTYTGAVNFFFFYYYYYYYNYYYYYYR